MFIHGRKSKPRDGVITPEGFRRPYSRPGASNRGFDSLDILIGGDQGVEWPPQSLRGICPGPWQLLME
jgi:hypothetical protein